MGDNLFTAYNYLSSAIAQAFAALIALTAMFYIYRMGKLEREIEELIKSLIPPFYDVLEARAKSTDPTITIHLPTINDLQLLSSDELLSRVNDLLDNLTDTKGECKDADWRIRSDWRQLSRKKLFIKKLKEFNQRLKRSVLGPIILSALAMLIGIAALLSGPKICSDDWRFVIMICESALAAVALGWTVIVVIKMLGEPKAEESPSP